MERNPNFRGPQPAFDEIQFIRYGNQDAVERALQLGEVDMVPEVQAATFERLGEQPNIETFRAPQPAYTQLAFNICPEKLCPDAEFNPAVQDLDVRQAIAYAIDRERINAIAARDTSFPAHGILPSFYKSFYEAAGADYPYDPDKANQILDDAGWACNDDGAATKDDEELSFDLYVRSESPYNIQAAKLVAEQARDDRGRVQRPGRQHRQAVRRHGRKVDGKPAPTFDTFIWGWGGDPYDPSFLLSFFTTDEIGGLSDSFYSNPEYDRLFKQQAGEFDIAERKEIIQRMVAITQRDLPYLVLTYDPNLQAYRTDKIANVEPVCPEETGDIFCDQIGYEPLLTIDAGGRQPARARRRASRAGLAIVAAIVFGVGGWILGIALAAAVASTSRWSWRSERRPAMSGRMSGRWLAGKVAAALLTFAFVIVFNFFLFRVMGDPTTQLARLPQSTPAGDRAAARRLRPRQAADRPVRRLRRRHAAARPRGQPAEPPAGLGRDQGRAAVDAAAGRRRHPARDPDRQLDGGGRRDPAREEGRRRAARLQPVHLRGARVLDRDHPDPRLRRLDTDLPGGAPE